jgi:hypothetical protein
MGGCGVVVMCSCVGGDDGLTVSLCWAAPAVLCCADSPCSLRYSPDSLIVTFALTQLGPSGCSRPIIQAAES